MSEFISNFLTYTTVALAMAGGYLSGVDFDAAPREESERTAFADPLLLTNETEDNLGEVEVASNDILFDPNVIRPAELHSVVFSSTGTASGLGTLTPVTDTRETGTVTGSSVNLRRGPGTSFAIAGRASGGDKLELTGERSGVWLEVVAPISGETAWIHGNYFDAPS